MLLGIFKISGHSMMPYLKPGDRVIVSSIPCLFKKPKIGDVVVVKDKKTGRILIKRIVLIENGKLSLEGDNKSDSLKIEPVKRKDILGRMIFRIKNNL